MNYHRNKKSITPRAIGIIVFLLVLGMFVFTPVPRLLFDMFEGVIVGQAEIAEENAGVFTSIFRADQVMEELQDLRAENESLRTQLLFIADGFSVLPQVEEAASDFSLEFERNPQILRIALRPPASGFDTLVLERRANTVVEVGDRVVAESNVLLGRVTHVFDETIHVQLFSHVGQEIQGLLLPQVLEVTVAGNGNANFRIEAPRDIEIEAGDRIYYAQNQDYPLGIVGKVFFDSRDPYKTVLAGIPVNIQHVRYVRIIR